MGKIYIVLATDENYVQHTGITMLSLLSNKQSRYPIEFIILTDSVSELSQGRLIGIGDSFGAVVGFYEVDLGCIDGLGTKKHISKMTYARMMLCELLPCDVRKVLYLDTDVIVRQDVTTLWEKDISGFAVGAVEEVGYYTKIDYKESIHLPLDAHYFNAGMLLMNLDIWRKEAIPEQLFSYMEKYPDTRNSDQDALNVVLYNRWLRLHPKWNVHKDIYTRYYSLSIRKFSKEALEAIRNPGVMHFTGPRKPWHHASAVPFSEEYMQYIEKSPWKGYTYPDIGLKSYWHRCRWCLRRKLYGIMRKLASQ